MKKAQYADKVITALLASSSVEEAAEKSGISKRTILRWLRDPSFRTEYARAKADTLKIASAILTRNAGKAAQILEKIFSGRNRPHQGARVAAAIGTLRLAIEIFAAESLEERLRQLEEQTQSNAKFQIN